MRKIFLPILILGVSSFIIFRNIANHDFHNDENAWIYDGKYFNLLFLQHDIRNPAWFEPNAVNVPPLGKYYFGFAAWIMGLTDKIHADLYVVHDTVTSRFFQWKSTNSWTGPFYASTPLRYWSAITGVLSCFLVFGIAAKMFNSYVAVLSWIIFLSNPMIVLFSQRILTSLLTEVFSLLTIYFLMQWHEEKIKKTNKLLFLILMGISLAFTITTKQTGIFTVLTVIGYFCDLLLQKIHHKGKRPINGYIRSTLSSLVMTICFCVFLFIVINPSFYSDPLSALGKMIQYRNETIVYQQLTFGPGLYTVIDRLTYVTKTIFFPNRYSFFYPYITIPLTFIFFAVGILFLLKEYLFERLKFQTNSFNMILLWFFIGSYGGLVFTLPLAWEGYIIPAIPSVAIITGYGLYICINALIHTIKKRYYYHHQF